MEAKLRCLYLPAQSGKTRKCEELIAEVKADSDLDPSIDIWISANNKLLVYQTTSRLKKDLGSDEDEEGPITGSIFSWTSGTKLTNIPAADLAREVKFGAELILVCAHRGRLAHVDTLIRQIAAFKKFNKRINLWIDEADQSIKLWTKLADVIALPIVNTVTLVSATFNDVFAVFPRLPVIPYRVTFPEVYRRLKDCEHIEMPADSYAPHFMEHVLSKHPHLMEPGMRAFIPAGLKCDYHEDMCARLLDKGFAVVLLNGYHKEIRMPFGLDTIPLKPFLTVKDPLDVPPEFNQTLSTLYVKHRLHRFPLAITGYLCVGRGVTFQAAPEPGVHKGFVFDYAIVHDIKNQATAYQTMARVFGNIGGFNERPCAIYAAATTFALIKKAEDTAVYLANLVHTEGLETVCMEDLERAAATEEEAKWVLHQTECATLADAEALVGTYGIKLKSRQSQDPALGYINRLLSDELMSYEDLTRRLTSMRKTAYMGCNRPVKARAMQGAHIFVGYRDLEDADSAVFIVRAIGKKVRKLVRKEVIEEPKKKRKLIRK
uniref:Uncharacterized protein n=1 Tax=viral metagenome TaxID=1070528 RepID=A0A6C0K2C1_9ZZZZ